MRRALQLLFAAVVLFASLPAFAAFSPAPGYPRRDDGRPVALTSPDPLAEPRAGFNRDDCFDKEQSIKLLLNDVPVEATDVEIWARRDGTSCADPGNRPGGTDVQCWKVAHWTRDEIVNKVVTFKPIQVIAAIDKKTSVDSAEGLDPATVCAKDDPMVPVATMLQIMAFNAGTVVGWSSGGVTGAVIGLWSAYDLAGPNPPTNLGVTPAPGGLDVHFDTTAPMADADGFVIYCFPGGSDAGCPTHPLAPGKFPSAALDPYVCASGTTDSGQMTVSGLSADKQYAVAIAARDKAGNLGKLSEVSCQAPAPAAEPAPVPGAEPNDVVTSGCTCAVGMARATTFWFAALAVGVAIALRRRQR